LTANATLTNDDYWWWVNCSDGTNTNISEKRNISINVSGVTAPEINFTEPPTPPNDTTTTNTSIEINVSITELNLDEVKFNWNGTNYTIFNDSLVLMMNFDNVSALGENNTHVVDVSGNGNNGTWENSTTGDINYTTGKYNLGIEFDGIDDAITVADDPSLDGFTSGFTVSVWVKYDALNTAYIVSKYDTANEQRAWILKQQNSSEARIYVCADGITAKISSFSFSPQTDTWYQMVGVWESNENPTLYVNGENQSVISYGDIVSSINDSTSPLRIGSSYLGNSVVNGTVDEVRIWNRSLSASEIRQLYFTNLNKYDPDKWALYVNQSKNSTDGLDDGVYTYQAFAKDTAGKQNQTETRTVTIDTVNPEIEFVDPTPDDNNITNNDYTYINVTATDTNSITAFIDWNNSLVGWWRFNLEAGEDDTDVVDWSGSGNNGTLENMNSGLDNCTDNCSGWTSSGKFGKAIRSDGYNDYIDVTSFTNIPDGNEDYTYELWFYISSLKDYNSLFSIGDNDINQIVYIIIPADGEINVVHFGGGEYDWGTGVYVDAGKWYHFVLTWNGTTEKLYLDGVQEAIQDNAAYDIDLTEFKIGYCFYRPLGERHLDGTIDEFRIWNRALSPEEINASYNAGLYRLETNYTSLADGTYDYTAYAQDLAGNLNQTETRTVTIDTQAPSVSIESPENKTYNISTIYFNLTASDAVTTVEWCGYILDHLTRPSWSIPWDYSRKITVNNTQNSENLTDYQTLVNLTSANFNFANANSDGNDTRFTWLNGTTEQNISFWIESWNSTEEEALVWVKVPYVAPNTNGYVYMYYGNAGAGSASDGRTTFIVWDDFDGGTEQWTETDDNALITIDRITNKRIDFALAGQTNERVYIDKGSDIGNFVMDFTMKITSDGNSNVVGAGVSDTLNWFSGWNDGIHGGVYTQRAGNQNFWPLTVYSDGTVYRNGGLDANYEGTTYYYTLIRNGSTKKGYIYTDNERTTIKASGTLTYSLQDLRYIYAISNHYNDPGYTTTMTGWVDDLRIRSYTATEPNTIIGTEEGTYHTMSNDAGNHYTDLNASMTEGQHNVIFRCNDSAGNINTTDAVYFYIDTTAPQVTGLTIIPTINSAGINYTNSTFTINATVSDSGIGLNTTTCEYSLNNGSSWTGATYSGNNCTITLNNQPDQSVYNISMRITDNASNTGNSTTIQVTIDGASPTLSIDPSSPACSEDTTPGFNLTVSDSGVGVDTCVFYIYVNG
ncbi:DUF2341 domain-containing protein, partial [archaeon]|nr:DUF2341 domain-containing protein [archaeon]